jgi:ornithine cyclodeaminase/alanine dehydrogenase-like protein (mu-crystallin family)
VRWLGAEEVARALPPLTAIEVVEQALEQLADGRAGTSGRQFHGTEGTPLAVMPGYAAGCVGLKVISVVERNRSRSLPTIQGAVVVFQEDTGKLLGVVDGPSLTAIRTAAIAGAATQRLAAPQASSFLMVGAGAQARAQVEAVLAVRPIAEVTIWNRTPAPAADLRDWVSGRHRGLVVRVTDGLQEAAGNADVITLATSSRLPLLSVTGLRPHCHINAMGAFRPDRREVATDVVEAAAIYADTVEGCLAEAGDLLIPMAEGRLDPSRVRSLRESGPGDQGRLTVMKSVGSAIFDLASAARALSSC